MKTISPFKEVAEAIIEAGGETLKSCYQCGLCTGTCPWNLVRSFMLRRMLHEAQFGVVDLESEDVWLCATCHACVAHCPRGVEVVDIMRAFRRTIVGLGVAKVPDSLRITMKNIAGVGNPQGEAPERRADWAKDLKVKIFTKGTELLYFPCCTSIFEPRVKGVAHATVDIFNKAKVDFGTLGTKENCCGGGGGRFWMETKRGERFADLRLEQAIEVGAEVLAVACPYCMSMLKDSQLTMEKAEAIEIKDIAELVQEVI